MMTFLIHSKWLNGALSEGESIIITPDEVMASFPELKDWMSDIIDLTSINYEEPVTLLCDNSIVPDMLCGVDYEKESTYPQ